MLRITVMPAVQCCLILISFQWDSYLCEKLGIPMSMLPEVKPSSCIYGECAKFPGMEDIAGIPIAGAIGDQPGALFRSGLL